MTCCCSRAPGREQACIAHNFAAFSLPPPSNANAAAPDKGVLRLAPSRDGQQGTTLTEE